MAIASRTTGGGDVDDAAVIALAASAAAPTDAAATRPAPRRPPRPVLPRPAASAAATDSTGTTARGWTLAAVASSPDQVMRNGIRQRRPGGEHLQHSRAAMRIAEEQMRAGAMRQPPM